MRASGVPAMSTWCSERSPPCPTGARTACLVEASGCGTLRGWYNLLHVLRAAVHRWRRAAEASYLPNAAAITQMSSSQVTASCALCARRGTVYEIQAVLKRDCPSCL